MNQQPPFRAEHIGSLLRPKELTQAFRRHNAGELDDDAFREIQDRAIRDVVALQEAAGLQLVTDGEFRRGSYWGHFIDPVAGLGIKEARFAFRDDHGHEEAFIAPHVEGPVSRQRGISLDEFSFLRSTTKVTPKLTMPSPPTFHFWRGREALGPGSYDGPAAFFADFAQVYRQEIAALYELGARYIQMDEVPLAMLCDPAVCDRLAAEGEDPTALVGLYIDAINDALGDRPADMVAGLHLCRGNHKGRYLSQGGYEPVAERMFSELNVDAFFMEYDTPRAGDFAPLRFLPADKRVVLGLVSSKIPQLEAVDDLARRIDEASAHVPLERLSLSPQCGFASSVAGNPVTEDVERRKLALLVETAQKVWGEA